MNSAEQKTVAAAAAQTEAETYTPEQVEKITCQALKEAIKIVSRMVTDPQECTAAIYEIAELCSYAPITWERKYNEAKQ